MTTLASRVALVTGGGRGIGHGIAIALAGAGVDVAITYRRDQEAAQATVEEITGLGGTARAFHASMEQPEELDQLVVDVRAALGNVDIFISNAGLASRGATTVDTDPKEVRLLMEAHAMAPFHLCRLLVPAMRTCGRGDIVIVSSAEVPRARAHALPYTMAKAAAETLAMTLAKEEAAAGIRVNIVAPGLVATDMGDRLVQARFGYESVEELDRQQPFGRVCRPKDIGAIVRFLVSAEGEMITGQRITVDGAVDIFDQP